MRYEEIKPEIHAFIILVGAVLSLVLEEIYPLVIAGIGAFFVMWWRRDRILSDTSASFGVANSITLGRLSLLIVATICFQFLGPVIYGIVALVVLIADGLDGYFARKLNEESEFGGNFDMETDSYTAAILTSLLYMKMDMDIGPWILVAGYLRYLFVFTLRILGLHNENSPDMTGAKLIAVIFFITLILPYLFSFTFVWWGLIVGATLIYISFAREFILIVRHKLARGK